MRRPSPGACFTYLTTLIAASIWDSLGACMNWLRLWTANDKSGLVTIKYKSLPTSLWYPLGSGMSGSSGRPKCASYYAEVSLVFSSIGDPAGLEPASPTSEISSKAYFLWYQYTISISSKFYSQKITEFT